MSGGISKSEFCDSAKALVAVVNAGLPYMQAGQNTTAANTMRLGVAAASASDCALALRAVRAPSTKNTLYGTQGSALQMCAASISAMVAWLDGNTVQIPADIINLIQGMVNLAQGQLQTNAWVGATTGQQAAVLATGAGLSLTANSLALKYCLTVYAPLVAQLQCMCWNLAPWIGNAKLPDSAYTV